MKKKKRIRKAPSLLRPSERDLALMEYYRQEASFFEGCSTPQEKYEKARAVIGVGRMSKYIESRLSFPTQEVWAKAALACTAAIVKKQNHTRTDRATLDVALPINYRVKNKKFPKGILVDMKDIFTVIMRVNASNFLDYIYELGYSSYTAKQLRAEIGQVEKLLNALDRQYELGDNEDIATMFEEDKNTAVMLFGAESEVVGVLANVVNTSKT